MKLMIKLLLLGLVGAIVAPMLIKGPDGRPLMSWQDFFSSSDSGAASVSSLPQSSSGVTTVYKWKDAEGQWHFSDKAIEGENHETLKYNPNANIIQSLAKKEEESEIEVKPVAALKETSGPSLTTVPLTEVPELMDQAKQYQSLIDQRNKSLEQFKRN
ncbi:DUF4124 domain-containing protein [Litoribacillus peritrichatus]|uniref:DUF4124 domain-containing protein n=1 Tax=Litoribacillus peritrichatus TaxID=718191 RepID=A0ABP7NDV8_9GAMM